MPPTISLIPQDDAERLIRGLELVRCVFQEHVAPFLDQSGVERFLSFTRLASLQQRFQEGHCAFEASQRGKLLGYMELRPPCHIAMLFVATAQQRQGIGRLLLCEAARCCRQAGGSCLTVNASPNAVNAYIRLGFYAEEDECSHEGILHTPMAMLLKASPLLFPKD